MYDFGFERNGLKTFVIEVSQIQRLAQSMLRSANNKLKDERMKDWGRSRLAFETALSTCTCFAKNCNQDSDSHSVTRERHEKQKMRLKPQSSAKPVSNVFCYVW
eukprot:Selendium_serpulae@DN5732_c0_g1_i2.p2